MTSKRIILVRYLRAVENDVMAVYSRVSYASPYCLALQMNFNERMRYA